MPPILYAGFFLGCDCKLQTLSLKGEPVLRGKISERFTGRWYVSCLSTLIQCSPFAGEQWLPRLPGRPGGVHGQVLPGSEQRQGCRRVSENGCIEAGGFRPQEALSRDRRVHCGRHRKED